MRPSNPILVLAVIALFALTCCEVNGSTNSYVPNSNIPTDLLTVNAWGGVGANTDFGSFVNSAYGQSFVAHRSGQISTINTLLATTSSIDQAPNLSVSIYSASNGIPIEKLGGVEISGGSLMQRFSVERDHRVEVDLNQVNIQVLANLEYLVAYETSFGVDVSNEGSAPYYVGIVIDSPNPIGSNLSLRLDGSNWMLSEPRNEILFELATAISIIPEPTTCTLALAAFCLAIKRNRARFLVCH